MNKIKYIISLFAVVLLLGCEKDEGNGAVAVRETKVTAGIGATRTVFVQGNGVTKTNWEVNDPIGVVSSKQYNLKYYATTGGASSDFKADEEKIFNPEGALYAYYPYNTEYDITNSYAAVPDIDVQNFKESASEYDFLYAKASATDNQVNFSFQHLFAFIKVTVSDETISDRGNNGGLYISSAANISCYGSQFDLANQEIITRNTKNDISYIIPENVSFSDGSDKHTYYIAILPQPANTEINIYKLVNGAPESTPLATRKAPESGFEAGNTYIVNLANTLSDEEKLAKEKQALIDIYNSTNGSSWITKTNWCSDAPVGEWHGITTDNDGFVIGLELDNNNLSGGLPESIADLTKIILMRLYDNNLTGIIPEAFTKTKVWRENWPNIVIYNSFNTTDLYIPAPVFSSTRTVDGKSISSNMYAENKFTILFRWTSNSRYASNISPVVNLLTTLYNKYKERGLEIVGFAGETVSELNTYLTGGLMANPASAWMNISTNYASGNDFVLNSDYFPCISVVDQNGVIVFTSFIQNINELQDFLSFQIESGGEIYTSTDYSQDGVVTQLQTASVGNGIDIVLMGDAYSDRLIADGTYETVMRKAADFLFVEEPYKSFRNMFNIYMVNVVSPNDVYLPNTITALECKFGTGTHVGGNDNKCIEYAQKALSTRSAGDELGARMRDVLIVVMMNSTKYAGTCYMYRYPSIKNDFGTGFSVSYFPIGEDDEAFKRVLNHETNGHGFAKLDDEYGYQDEGHIKSDEAAEHVTLYKDFGWYKNTDVTSDPATIKWKHFLNDSRYADQGLGIFEGGSTYWSGVWRPTDNSIMRHNTGGFNAPSREAIYYRMHKLAYGEDWVYNYEEFVEFDLAHYSSAATRGIPYKAEDFTNFVPLAPPVIIDVVE